MNEQDNNHHDGLTVTRQQMRGSIHPARPQQGNNLGWGRFPQQHERGYGPIHHLGAMDRWPGLTTGGRMGEIKDRSNLARPNEETTTHPNEQFSRGNNYFGQSGGEATKPNPTQNEPFCTQETHTGGGDNMQKTKTEATLNEGDNPRETTNKSRQQLCQCKYYCLATVMKQRTKKFSKCSTKTKHQKSTGAVTT